VVRQAVAATFALFLACGGAKNTPSSPSAVASAGSSSTGAPSTAPQGRDAPALAMVLDTKSSRGTPLGNFLVLRPAWDELRDKARLKIDRDVDWIAVGGPSLDPREDIVVAHLAVPDEAIDKVLAQDADTVDIGIPGVRAWSWHGLPNGRVVFRSRSQTLGTAPLALLVSRDAIARVVELAADVGPIASVTLHRTDRIRASLPPKMRELRVTVNRSNDGGAEVQAEADFDDADGAMGARQRLREWVDSARTRDANAAKGLSALDVTTDGASARARLRMTGDELRDVLAWLRR
jgi:hypothetical protein